MEQKVMDGKNLQLSRYTSLIHSKGTEKTLILNTLVANADLLPEHLSKNFKTQWPQFSARVLSYLYERGYLIKAEDKTYEDKFIEGLKAEYEESKDEMPGHYVIAPTLGCNFRCDYCFQPHETHEHKSIMTISDLKTVFSAIEKIESDRNA